MFPNKHLQEPSWSMVGEMVQNSQIQYSFTFNVFIFVHEYIHSHSTTALSLNLYKDSHSTTYFLVTNIFIYIRDIYSFTFKVKISIQHGCNIHSTFGKGCKIHKFHLFLFSNVFIDIRGMIYSFTFNVKIFSGACGQSPPAELHC